MTPPANTTTEPGVFAAGSVWHGRLRLEQEIPARTPAVWWHVTDLRTGTRQTAEWIAAKTLVADTAAARLAEGWTVVPAGVLQFFRAEPTADGVWAVAGVAPALEAVSPWTAEALAAAAPETGMRVVLELARAVAALHEQGRPAHGAISPRRVVGGFDAPLLLTGYPYAALVPLDAEVEFASSARRGGQPPMHVDDIFSLGALLYFVLTGGAEPPVFAATPTAAQSIDRVRQARGLAPTGWNPGWDAAILSALREVPSLRPTAVRALVDQTARETNLVPPPAAAAPAARRMRQSPSWRRGAGRPAPVAGSSTAQATAGLAADWLQRLTEERAQLSREREESERRQVQLAADLEKAGQERRELDALSQLLGRERTTLLAEQAELAETKANLAALRAKVDTSESGLAGREQALAARLAETERRETEVRRTQGELQAAEAQLQARTAEAETLGRQLVADRTEAAALQAKLDQLRQSLAAEREQLRADQTRLAEERDAAAKLRAECERRATQCQAEETRLQELSERMETRGAELEARDKALHDVQRTIATMAGGADVNKWLEFASQVEARGQVQEKRTAELAALQEKITARAMELEAEQRRLQDQAAAARRLQEENEKRQAELAAEKQAVARLHQEAQQALEVVRRAARPSRAAPEPTTPAPAPTPAPVAAPANPVVPGSVSVPPPPPPPPVPVAPPPPAKATVEFANERRLHVFGGPVVRFGRHGQSDIILIALAKGQREPTLVLNKDISRKHFELHVAPEEVRVRDGWSDEPAPSRAGLCVDGRRVGPDGATLQTGSVLSVTTRPLGRTIPHWEATLFGANGRVARGAAGGPLSALFLKRLDDAPDDLLVLLGRIRPTDCGAPADADAGWLLRTPEGFALLAGERTVPFVAGATPVAGIRILSLGFTSPTVSLPSGTA